MRKRLVAYPAAVEPGTGWERLPMTFHRMPSTRVLVCNSAGEHLLLSREEFDQLALGQISDPDLLRRLRSRHLVRDPDDSLPIDLLAMKERTRYSRLSALTQLHIFVVTLRCEHSCHYCQVSRRTADRAGFDMTVETAEAALAVAFCTPSRSLKIEFQGGEPLLNFGTIKWTVLRAKEIAVEYEKEVSFVITTNLALLDDDVISFCRDEEIFISTSLDGPESLHNRNRPRPGHDSWARTISGIRRIQAEIGPHAISALMTTTETSLTQPTEIIDTYIGLDLLDIFLRPISPYGLAVRSHSHDRYGTNQWLAFWRAGLDYILELNRNGVPAIERYSAIVLSKMLSGVEPGYVDLRSPAGIGIGALLYNYDGDVYASDEGRMLAEMSDHTFRLGNLETDGWDDLLLSEQLLDPLDQSLAQSAPMCSDCAFERFCGADPVYHHATSGDFLGRKPTSGFCNRNMGVFETLIERYHDDPHARGVFQTWAAT